MLDTLEVRKLDTQEVHKLDTHEVHLQWKPIKKIAPLLTNQR